jgi:hypothetical protein
VLASSTDFRGVLMGKFRLPSHTTVAAYVGCFAALATGGAYAANELGKNDVRSKHIGKGQVKNADLANEAVTSPKVANGSLLNEDFAPGQSLPGNLERVSTTSNYGAIGEGSTSAKAATAECPGTKQVVGSGYNLEGGFSTGTGPSKLTDVAVTSVELAGGDPIKRVIVTAMEEEPTAADWEVTAYALCATILSDR